MIRSMVPADDTLAALYNGKSPEGEPALIFHRVHAWASVDFGGMAENRLMGVILWQGLPTLADDIDIFCGYVPEAVRSEPRNSNYRACVAQAWVIQRARDMREVN